MSQKSKKESVTFKKTPNKQFLHSTSPNKPESPQNNHLDQIQPPQAYPPNPLQPLIL